MIQIFQITTVPGAPRLRLARPDSYGPRFLRFDGEEKGAYSPHQEFDVVADPCEGVYQFYDFAPGVLAGPVEGLCECSHMLYATGGNERLALLADGVPFTAINPIDFFPALEDGPVPWPEGFFAPVFRLRDQDPLDLFCVSGLVHPMDDFKKVYDHYEFKGLRFEEFWRSG